jgi:hypothetical protein
VFKYQFPYDAMISIESLNIRPYENFAMSKQSPVNISGWRVWIEDDYIYAQYPGESALRKKIDYADKIEYERIIDMAMHSTDEEVDEIAEELLDSILEDAEEVDEKEEEADEITVDVYGGRLTVNGEVVEVPERDPLDWVRGTSRNPVMKALNDWLKEHNLYLDDPDGSIWDNLADLVKRGWEGTVNLPVVSRG